MDITTDHILNTLMAEGHDREDVTAAMDSYLESDSAMTAAALPVLRDQLAATRLRTEDVLAAAAELREQCGETIKFYADPNEYGVAYHLSADEDGYIPSGPCGPPVETFEAAKRLVARLAAEGYTTA